MVLEDTTTIIPALNEESSIGHVLKETLKVCPNVIVVDDGSTDRTAEIVRSEYPSVMLLQHDDRRGKGAAVRYALERTQTPYVALQDADCEYPPGNLALLADAGQCDMVVGQRTMVVTDFYRQVSMGSFTANKIFAHLAGVPDVFSGQRILNTEFMRSLDLRANGFEIETEMTFKAIRRRASVVFVPVGYHPRTKAEGKKICFKDFIKISAMYCKLSLQGAPA